MVRAAERTEMHIKVINDGTVVHSINRKKGKISEKKAQEESLKKQDKPIMSEIFNCRNCGTKHKRKECPAYGKKCHRCQKLNHFKVMCRSKKNVNMVERQEDSYLEETLFVGAVTSEVQNDEWYVTINIEKQKTKLKVDTGSQVNILNINQLKRIAPKPSIKESTHKLISYTGNNLAVLGSIELCVESEANQSRNLTFYIVDTDQPGLLGLTAAKELGLIKIVGNTRIDLTSKKSTVDLKKEVIKKHPKIFSAVWVA